MGSLGNPKVLVPYMNSKDCSQGFCSIYCPEWCSMIFPPPPPLHFQFLEDNSTTNFSPLVIAIIGILASAFLLVSYYTLISKYCGNAERENHHHDHHHHHQSEGELEDNHNPSLREPWHVATAGLDEALIKSIAVVKYKKGDGLVEVTDCSVCLSEFEDDESLRLLPKCSHAFHIQCIDTWLMSHSNCPLCRANIAFISNPQPQLPPQVVTETSPPIAQDLHRNVAQRPPFGAFSDLGNSSEGSSRDTVVEIGIGSGGEDQTMRRSVSMNYLSQNRVSVADILCISESEDHVDDDDNDNGESSGGSSKQCSSEEMFKSSNVNRLVHCVLSPVAMRRSFSSGGLFVTKYGCRGGKGKAIIPV